MGRLRLGPGDDRVLDWRVHLVEGVMTDPDDMHLSTSTSLIVVGAFLFVCGMIIYAAVTVLDGG